MNSRKIYILLSHTGTVLTRLIKLYTRSPYNHVSVGFDKKLHTLYSFGRKKPRNPFIGGFVRENIHEGLYRIKKRTKCQVYEMDITEKEFDKLKNKIEQFERNIHKYKFNALGLFSVIFNIPRTHEYKRFCAEFVAEVLEESGIYIFGKPYGLIRPDHFSRIPNLKKIYEGQLRFYPE